MTLLRVSTKKQLYTAIDIDADGNSIATQRDVTALKADALGATITREFIEPGNSGKTVDQRPVLKELLGYLHEHPEVRYVIVYMRSRAFRNHFDAALVQIQLAKIGVRLASAKEDFGQGAAAVAMEGMVDIMNGFQNTLQGLDVQAKMGRKARAGGTVSLAKIGYLNIRGEARKHRRSGPRACSLVAQGMGAVRKRRVHHYPSGSHHGGPRPNQSSHQHDPTRATGFLLYVAKDVARSVLRRIRALQR